MEQFWLHFGGLGIDFGGLEAPWSTKSTPETPREHPGATKVDFSTFRRGSLTPKELIFRHFRHVLAPFSEVRFFDAFWLTFGAPRAPKSRIFGGG